jgi:hypothetical protein
MGGPATFAGTNHQAGRLPVPIVQIGASWQRGKPVE